MYEDKDFDSVMEDKLSEVRTLYPGLDTRKGSVIYTTLAPDSVEETMMYMALGKVWKETFASTSEREGLVLRCADRGIMPIAATYAQGKGVFTKGDGTPFDFETIDESLTFTCGQYLWRLTEKLESGSYLVTCTTPGEEPNNYLGKLVPTTNIKDLATANMVEISVYGEEEEDTETLRARYFASFTNIAYGFNVAEYVQVIGAMQGVGGVRVYRASKLDENKNVISIYPGHVAIVIQDSEYGVPTQTLVDKVQTEIDPTQNAGDGIGLAPIDHEVHIKAVEGKVINIETSIEFKPGIVYNDCKEYVIKAVQEYIDTLNKEWQSTEQIIVRISYIESVILALTDYVVDISNTKINGNAENLTLRGVEIAKLGEVVDV